MSFETTANRTPVEWDRDLGLLQRALDALVLCLDFSL